MPYLKTVSAGAPSNDALQLGAAGESVRFPVGALAAAGSDQAGAGAITEVVTIVSAADGTKGVRLPTAAAGRLCIVYSSVATNGLKVYPATGAAINGGTGDAAVTIEGKTMAIFMGESATNWGAIYTANT